MLERLRRRRNEKGFTLIELLVVVIIIGLLAAIAIPAFLGQRNKANDAAAKSLVRNGATAMEAFFSDGNTYATATPTNLRTIEPNISWSTTASDAASDQVKVSGLSAHRLHPDGDQQVRHRVHVHQGPERHHRLHREP